MKRRFKKWTVRISVILLIALFVAFSAIELLIGWRVRIVIQRAQEHYSGDHIEALIATVECESCNLRERDSAVWALGPLADRRALPVLEKHYTGKPCNHLTRICEYELSKALRQVRNGGNTESIIWRWMLPG
jgi:hypothetical protein